jgi:23S rRNA pseudouridine2605 synthase
LGGNGKIMRLQKYMAHCGVGSRRKCEDLIKQGRVFINGKQVTEMGIKVDIDKDTVSLDQNQVLKLDEEKIYIILNKPRGTITSVSDPHGRKTVLEHMGWKGSRIYPVGRLDFDTEGVLLLSNDGDFAYEMTHPKHEVEKEYYCVVEGSPDPASVNKLRQGVEINGFVTSPAKVTLIEQLEKHTVFRMVIHEGKNRQVRRMFEAIGHPVIYLRRESFGGLRIKDMSPGEWRKLTDEEIKKLKSLTGGKGEDG